MERRTVPQCCATIMWHQLVILTIVLSGVLEMMVPTMAMGPPNKAPVITGRGQSEYVVLSFDDGPNEDTTPVILDTLKRYNVPAAFFFLGTNLKAATGDEPSSTLRDIVHRTLEDGHFVGSHTMDHSNLAKLKLQEVQQEIEDAEKVMKELTGFRPFLIRAPFGSLNDRAREYLGAKAYVVVHYLTDLRDRSFTRSDPFLRSVEEQLPTASPENAVLDVERGGILLLHDIRLTARTLGPIIESLLRKGYKIVPLSYFMLSTEKKALHGSYRCGRDNSPLLDRMCEQLQPFYDYTSDWQPMLPEFLTGDGNDRTDEPKLSHERAEYLYELLREQLNRETAIREEKQSKLETELGQVWNTTLSRIKKTYSQLGDRLDVLESRLKKYEGKVEKELETVNWNLAKDIEDLIEEIDLLKQDREDKEKSNKITDKLQRLTEKQQQQITRVERKMQQVANVALGFVALLLLFLLFTLINRGWPTLTGGTIPGAPKQDHRHNV